METFGFLITSYLENKQHLMCLFECIQSILCFYKEEQIVILFAKGTYEEGVKEVALKYPNTKRVFCDGTATMNSLQHIYFDKTIILHDSMTIKQSIPFYSVTDVQFLWYFTNHRLQWSTIEEPKTEYNSTHGIKTHDDLIIHLFKKYAKGDFLEWALDMYWKKDEWVGCFGNTCIITKEFVQKLDEKTGIISILSNLSDNRERRAAESIFSLACKYVITGIDVLDGLYYDGYGYSNNGEGKFITKRVQSFER